MRTGEKDAAPKTNMEPKKLVVCRCFSFSKGGIFRFHVSFSGVYQSNFVPEALLEVVFFFIFRDNLPKEGIAKMGFLHFCW